MTKTMGFAPRYLFVLAALAVAFFGLGQSQPSAAAVAASRNFDPIAFFNGSTEGRGTLKKALSGKQKTHVTGTGVVKADGQLIIDQVVKIEGEKTQTRHWQLREGKPGNYSGTISDAKGLVTAAVAGNQLNIKYKMKEGGYSVAQVLTMAADGKSVHNAMKIKKFGIVFATIDETIRKL